MGDVWHFFSHITVLFDLFGRLHVMACIDFECQSVKAMIPLALLGCEPVVSTPLL